MTLNFSTSEDLDFGVCTDSKAILYEGNDRFEEDDIVNPFYLEMTGGNCKQYDKSDLYKGYTSVIVLSSADSGQCRYGNFFRYKIKNTDFKDMTDICFFRGPISLIRNNENLEKINIVAGKFLAAMFPDSKFNESELVFMVPELSNTTAKRYCELYDDVYTLDDIKFDLNLAGYYTNDGNRFMTVQNSLIDKFEKLRGANYWSLAKNCAINATSVFIDREFNSKRSNVMCVELMSVARKETKAAEKLLEIQREEERVGANGKDYPHVEPEARKAFDNVQAVKRPVTGKRTFFECDQSKTISIDQFNILFDSLKSEKERYHLVHNVLASNNMCHLVANNAVLLGKINPLIEKYKHVFKYTLGYAWITLHLEEILIRKNVTKQHRFVFDINTASKLPVFPYNVTDIKQNPYIVALVDDSELDWKSSGLTYINEYEGGYGIADFKTFKRRFNIFMSGSPDIDMLQGIDWSKVGISGSIMPACLQKRSPLLDICVRDKNGNEDEGFKLFLSRYYKTSDIDVMTLNDSVVEFIKNVQQIYAAFKRNTKSNDSDMTIEPKKQLSLSLTKYFFIDCLDAFNKEYNLNLTSEEFKNIAMNETDSHHNKLKCYLYFQYTETKRKLVSDIVKNENPDFSDKFWQEYIRPFDYNNMNVTVMTDEFSDVYNAQVIDSKTEELITRRNNFNNNKFDVKENYCVLKIGESIRYVIVNKKINKTIEVFNIFSKTGDFFSTVGSFHLPCVRAYYQNENVYMLPSCVTALHTGINIEYKYFAGVRNPTEIIYKYMKRGFGVLLNKHEVKKLEEHITSNNYPSSCVKLFKTLQNEMFGLTNVPKEMTALTNNKEISAYYNAKSKYVPVDATMLVSITKEGNVNKYKQSIVDLCFDE